MECLELKGRFSKMRTMLHWFTEIHENNINQKNYACEPQKLVRIAYNKYVCTIEIRAPSSLTFSIVHILTKLTLFPSTSEA
jgi:hypothetical protein